MGLLSRFQSRRRSRESALPDQDSLAGEGALINHVHQLQEVPAAYGDVNGLIADADGLQQEIAAPLAAPAEPIAGDQQQPQIRDPLANRDATAQIPGLGDIAALGARIEEALRQGNATVEIDGAVVDLRQAGAQGGMFSPLDLRPGEDPGDDSEPPEGWVSEKK